MKKIVLACFLFSFTCINPLWAQSTDQIVQEDVPILVRKIILSGFILNNRGPLDKIIKLNRNKHLTQRDIERIIKEINGLYLENGFAGLVEIDYKISKHKLLINITLQK